MEENYQNNRSKQLFKTAKDNKFSGVLSIFVFSLFHPYNLWSYTSEKLLKNYLSVKNKFGKLVIAFFFFFAQTSFSTC